MKNQSILCSVLNTSCSRWSLTSVFILTLVSMCTSAKAQGVAGGPFTAHDVEPGPVALVGSPGSPIPIDLDPTAPPWTKGFFDPNMLGAGDATIDLIETIQNVGTESWADWHEHILGDPASASAPSFWSGVVSVEINSVPISFVATGIGTKDLWLDTFSQPVLPGDILTIHKQVDVFSNTAGADGFPLIRMQQFPTPVIPEPTTLALISAGSIMLLLRKRC